MAPELLLAPPGRPLQVIVLERVDQDLPLVQPGGIGGRIARSPPAVALGEVPLRTARYMARSPSWIRKTPRSSRWCLRKSPNSGR